MNTFKVTYTDKTSYATNANGSLKEFSDYITSFPHVSEDENGKETTRTVAKVEQIIYHVFADMLDDFHTTLPPAIEQFDELVSKGFLNVRLYEEVYNTAGECVEEKFIKGVGGYPA